MQKDKLQVFELLRVFNIELNRSSKSDFCQNNPPLQTH